MRARVLLGAGWCEKLQVLHNKAVQVQSILSGVGPGAELFYHRVPNGNS